MRGKGGMKKHLLRKTGALAVLVLLFAALFALPASANDIHTVEVWVTLHRDGSATVKETWDITMTNASNTEWYVAKHNLDNMEITGLTVQEVAQDGTLITFQTLTRWNLDATRAQKAQTCGLVETNGGYEVCWGFGTLGRHSYIVTYTITNLVKSYQGGDAMSYNFLSDADGGADALNIYLSADGFAMEYPATKVWVFGYEAESGFVDGGISILGQGRFGAGDYAVVLLAFEEGLLAPADRRGEALDDIIERNMKGSVWEAPGASPGADSGGSWTVRFDPLSIIIPLVLIYVVIFGFFSLAFKRGGKGTLHQKIVSGAAAEYCRDLPFQGDLEATYTRLHDLGQAEEGTIIGCYLLKWVQARQVEIIAQPAGLLRRREEPAIGLHPPAPDMPQHERQLYRMLTEAAGPDGVLQSREFEKWSRKRYSRVGGFLSSCQSAGKRSLLDMQAYTTVNVKRFFGLITSTVLQVTEHGMEMTNRAFGFKRYLWDFTILNEREAHEVHLWNQYLIFAQLLGIADRVAEQFAKLYPDSFAEMNAGGYGFSDSFAAEVVSRSFARSMYNGYRSGRSAAESSSGSSGGGGSSSSSGGGGGSSGGGGAGGR